MGFTQLASVALDCLFVGLCIVASHKATASKWLFALLVLPGTVLHELAHWAMALLCNGRPRAPSVVPNFTGKRWTLGYVIVDHPTWYNRPLIALAPLLLLPLAYLGYRYEVRPLFWWEWRRWLILYVVAMTLASALPSKEDLQMAQRQLFGLLLLGLVLALSAWGLKHLHWPARHPAPVKSISAVWQSCHCPLLAESR